jgi:hypothetical protein
MFLFSRCDLGEKVMMRKGRGGKEEGRTSHRPESLIDQKTLWGHQNKA